MYIKTYTYWHGSQLLLSVSSILPLQSLQLLQHVFFVLYVRLEDETISIPYSHTPFSFPSSSMRMSAVA